MKAPYTYTVLRYVHDVATGEFANVGVLVYSPDFEYLEIRCSKTYGRISQFFSTLNGKFLRLLLRHLDSSAGQLQKKIFMHPRLEPLPKDAAACARRLLPPDDSSIQFSELGVGLTSDPAADLAFLYERYVERYASKPSRATRMDDDILPILKSSLAQRRVYLEPKVIEAPNYKHEFPLAWKNGMWNTCDAVSFDLSSGSDILEKANRWLGRAHTLRESSELFKLVLFLGQPRQEELWPSFQKAENILNTMPGPFELVREDEANSFAEEVEKEVKT
ncbi:MAG TPA: DUF3037 domain-containing protein [Thermoanaerobaculia bacterium]|nr:DUF3037 domain-containing protein [Thermoanaerobaculia bacterium]